MNAKDQKYCKDILNVLHDHAPKSVEQTALFGEVNAKSGIAHAQFTAALKIADTQGWLTGVAGKFSGQLWAINDEGEIARLQL